MMNMNPVQFINLLRGRNPQEMVMSILKGQNINDPMINELVNLAQKGDTNSVTKIAESYFSQRGMDFNKEFNSFMSMLK